MLLLTYLTMLFKQNRRFSPEWRGPRGGNVLPHSPISAPLDCKPFESVCERERRKHKNNNSNNNNSNSSVDKEKWWRQEEGCMAQEKKKKRRKRKRFHITLAYPSSSSFFVIVAFLLLFPYSLFLLITHIFILSFSVSLFSTSSLLSFLFAGARLHTFFSRILVSFSLVRRPRCRNALSDISLRNFVTNRRMKFVEKSRVSPFMIY